MSKETGYFTLDDLEESVRECLASTPEISRSKTRVIFILGDPRMGLEINMSAVMIKKDKYTDEVKELIFIVEPDERCMDKASILSQIVGEIGDAKH